jgi:hypothetical protein
MNGAFCTLFPFGYPLIHKGPVNDKALKHMLNQCSNAFTSEPHFIMHQFNLKRRRLVSQGVTAVFKDDQTCLDDLKAYRETEGYKEKLEE